MYSGGRKDPSCPPRVIRVGPMEAYLEDAKIFATSPPYPNYDQARILGTQPCEESRPLSSVVSLSPPALHSSAMSLALPWEVIEGVIEHSSDSVVTLYSFTLTCRDHNPRSTILLLDRIVLKNRDQLFALCDVLSAKPHLQPIVRSITISPDKLYPHPLLRLLSNLSEIEFATSTSRFDSGYATAVTLHSSVLKYCRQFGEHIQRLSLERVHLPSLSAFSGILLSFERVRSLSCSHLKVVKDGAHQELITRRLSQQLHLRTLVVGVDHTVSENVLTLLGEVAKHTVTNLIFINPDFHTPIQGSHGTNEPEEEDGTIPCRS
ncbi:hypothetical protein LXA43DRAFT_537742 [Ganoderma leucocontextum]|nr:hypothetical protein LXA43DRAFT_537742 [Ganoderma leucocontextum]